MNRLDEDAQRFYVRLAARAEDEDYCPIEQVIAMPKGMSTTAEELASLVREVLDGAQPDGAQQARESLNPDQLDEPGSRDS